MPMPRLMSRMLAHSYPFSAKTAAAALRISSSFSSYAGRPAPMPSGPLVGRPSVNLDRVPGGVKYAIPLPRPGLATSFSQRGFRLVERIRMRVRPSGIAGAALAGLVVFGGCGDAVMEPAALVPAGEVEAALAIAA